MRRFFYVSVFIVTLALSGICLAEDRREDVSNPRRMDEVVVSATKTEESLKDVSNSVIIKDSIDIQDSGAKSIGHLLGNEQGIDFRTYGDYGGAGEEIHIRGMGADGTQVLVNGVVINSPSLGTANLNGIPVNNIEKIEVVKGAGSLLYGTSAMGGIINIITKRPERDLISLKAKTGYGSHGIFELAAENGMFLTDSIGYYLTANMMETDGFRNNADLDHKDFSFRLVYENEDTLDISLYGDYVDREFGRPGPKPPLGTTDFIDTVTTGLRLYTSESANLLNRGGDENSSVVLDVKCNPFEWLGLRFKGSRLDMENYNYNRYYSTYPVGVPGSKTWVTNSVLGFEVNGDIQVNREIQILLGNEYKKYDWKNSTINIDETGAEAATGPTSTSQDLNTKGFFSEGQYRPCDYFKLIAGIRLEDHSEFGKKYVPRFGIIVNPYEDTVFKINYGKHYNAPTPNDLFWPYEDWGWGMGAEGNANLRPETGKHADVSIEKSFLDDIVLLNASYFKWDIKDKIRWQPDTSFFYQPQNLDTYTGDGWEMGIDIGPWRDMTLGLSYTYSDAEEELAGGVSRQALYTSDRYIKCDLGYFNESGLGLMVSLRYTGDRPGSYTLDTDTEPSVTLASYYTVDVNLQHRLFENWSISIQCSNLFNKEYDTYTESFWDNTTSTSSMANYPGAGRSIFLSMSYEY